MSEICFPVTGGWQRKAGRKGNKNSHVSFIISPAFINAWKRLQGTIWTLKQLLQAATWDWQVVWHVRLEGIVHVIGSTDLCS